MHTHICIYIIIYIYMYIHIRKILCPHARFVAGMGGISLLNKSSRFGVGQIHFTKVSGYFLLVYRVYLGSVPLR